MPDTALRTWELRCVGARPLTINVVARIHRHQWAQQTRESRRVWWALAKQAKVPALAKARIEIVPLHKNLKAPQDPAACAPAAKAAIDGLVDAGVLPDDTGEYVASIEFFPPAVEGVDGMLVRIIEVAP